MNSVIKGKLKLKGVEVNQTKKKKHRERREGDRSQFMDLERQLREEEEKEKADAEDEYRENPIKIGKGRIITSSCTIHGKETNFLQEFEIGDEIMVEDELGFKKEVKIINMVLSNKSAGVSEPFEKDYITSVPFKYRKKPVLKKKEKKLSEVIEDRLKKDKRDKIQKKKQNQKKFVEYELRTKKGMWSYGVQKHKIELKGDQELSKEDLLDLRVKNATDKFCWF